ncbi:MAG: DNA polymerase III subunit beta [Lachnospirales bacterium]
MNVICEKTLLINAINTVSKAVDQRSTMDILKCILLVADRAGFRLIGNDLELSIETANMETEMYEKGEVAIDAKMFSDIIRNMSGDFITIKTDDKNLCTITSDKSTFKIMGQPSSSFPKPSEVKKDNGTIEVGALDLKNAVKKTIFAVATEETRPILTGELFRFDEGFLHIVAIDGFRVSWRKIKVDYDIYTEMVVPSKTLNEIIRLLPDDNDKRVYIHYTSRHIMFEVEGCIIISRLLDGDFLRYESFFSGETNTKVTVNTVDFLRALERATIITPPNRKTTVNLDINNNIMNINTKTDLGTSDDDVSIKLEGDELHILFNAKYLIDIMKNCEEEYVVLNLNTNKSPCVVTGITNDDFKYLVLPIDPRL